MDHFEFYDHYEVITDDFVFAVERQDETTGTWSNVFATPIDVNQFRIEYTDWNDLQAKGVIYANATWRAAIYGEGMVGEPLHQTQPVRLGHSAACFKPAYEAATERYKQQNGFDHRHLPPASAGAADQVVRAIAATMLADAAVTCRC